MLAPPIPANESDRLKEFIEADLLDTPNEKEFDDIVKLASDICQTPISLITLLDSDRQWFKAKIGVDIAETSRDVSFCGHAISDDKLFEVPDTLNDERFRDNPFVTNAPNVRYYAGYPLITGTGHRLGTLCVIDSVPRELTESQKFALGVLSRNVIKIAELRQKNKQLNHMAETQKKMTSILAHDVRSPLASIRSIMDYKHSGLITEEESEELMDSALEQLDSTVHMVDDIVDWGEAQLKYYEVSKEQIQLKDIVENIFRYEALKAKLKGNEMLNEVNGIQLNTDRHALTFIIRNLVSNANKYTENGVISVSASTTHDHVQIRIKDTGIGMNSDVASTLFSNKTVSAFGTRNEKGNGLGLLLISEYINKLNGSITVETESGKGSCFIIKLSTL